MRIISSLVIPYMCVVNYWRRRLGGKATMRSPNLSLQFTGAWATWLANCATEREFGRGRAGRPDLPLEDNCSKEARGEERTSRGPIIHAWDHKQPWWTREHPHREHVVPRLSASARLAPAHRPVLGTGNEGGGWNKSKGCWKTWKCLIRTSKWKMDMEKESDIPCLWRGWTWFSLKKESVHKRNPRWRKRPTFPSPLLFGMEALFIAT